MIILNIASRIIGIVVDEVSDVIKVKPEDINDPPELGVAFDSKYLQGLVTIEDDMVILVNTIIIITVVPIAISKELI